MSRPLVLVGASGFGREALDVVAAHNEDCPASSFQIVGVLDDAPSSVNLGRLARRGVRHLGGIAGYLEAYPPSEYVLAIGSPTVRARLVPMFDAAGWHAPCIAHPAAGIGTMPDWADGVVICAGAQLSTNVRAGRHVHVNPNATIGHDADLRDFVSVNPAATISGEVLAEEEVLVGAGAIVLQGLRVGKGAIVGAGAVVTKHVPPGSVVTGVPGRW